MGNAGISIPGEFPKDYEPVFGMSVAGAVAYYAQAMQTGWHVDDVGARVQETKEHIYRDLTASGLDAFAGVKSLILAAKDLGMVIGIGSSGVLCAERVS